MADTEQGGQVELAHGDQRVGGRRRSAAASGRTRSAVWRCSTDSLPASGRRPGVARCLPRGRTGSRTGATSSTASSMQLPLTEPEHGNAIHGLVRSATWSVVDLAPDRVVMRVRARAEPGYPFLLALSIEYALSDAGLAVTTTAHEHRRGEVPVRVRAAPVSDARDADRRPTAAAGAGAGGCLLRRAWASRTVRLSRRNRVRLPRGADDRRDRARQRLSPSSSAATTAAPVSCSTTRTAARA